MDGREAVGICQNGEPGRCISGEDLLEGLKTFTKLIPGHLFAPVRIPTSNGNDVIGSLVQSG